jgi:uncharacterized membrane-anchored protein YjiN (DUF445 family)
MENGDNGQRKGSNSQKNKLTIYEQFTQYLREQENRPSVVFDEVEDFLKGYKKGDFVLSDVAKTMRVTMREGKNWRGKPKKNVYPFCDVFGNAVGAYHAAKEINRDVKWEEAYKLLDLIERGKAFGAILDVRQQRKDYEQEIEKLKSTIDHLRKLNTDLLSENKTLHNLVPHKNNDKRSNTEVGDVF